MNNKTLKLPDVNTLILMYGSVCNCMDADMRKNFLNHIENEKNEFNGIDFIVNELLTAEGTNLTITITGVTSETFLI